MKKIIALLVAAVMVLGLAAAVAEEEAGFQEYPIFDGEGNEFTDVEVQVTEGSKLNVSAVYFQPVKMEPVEQAGTPVEDANFHLELDVSWLENGLGYGIGDWLPFVTVDYSITDAATGAVASEGSFMPMNASDGPHYGANIALATSGTYNIEFKIHSPYESGFLLHVDDETGPEEKAFWTDPVVITITGWDYLVQDWE